MVLTFAFKTPSLVWKMAGILQLAASKHASVEKEKTKTESDEVEVVLLERKLQQFVIYSQIKFT